MSTSPTSSDENTPAQTQLSYREIQHQRRQDRRTVVLSGAGAIWLNTFMVTASIGLMIYVGFTKELFFPGEQKSEFVFAVTMCMVLALWYVYVGVQLFKVRRIEFFANDKGAYILANRSRHDYFFLPWERVNEHVVARGYYNGSAAAITLHTDFTSIPLAIIERGSSHGQLENNRAHFSVIPKCFVSFEEVEKKINELRGA